MRLGFVDYMWEGRSLLQRYTNAHLPPYLGAFPFNFEEAYGGREWEKRIRRE